MKLMLSLVAFCFAAFSFAGVVPQPAGFDKGIRTVAYNPLDVYEINTQFAHDTHLWFSDDETVMLVSTGDPEAWFIGPEKILNNMFVRPIGDKPNTNMTVVTALATGGKRVYTFRITAEWLDYGAKSKNPMDMIRFTYPEVEDKAATQVKHVEDINSKLSNAATDKVRNLRYSFAGATTLEPEEIFDDGTFTWIRFAANGDLPAIYHVNTDGSEQIVDFHIEDEYQIIHRVSPRFIFRKGSAVAGVFNDAFDMKGVQNRTGTVSPEVKRVIKADQ